MANATSSSGPQPARNTIDGKGGVVLPASQEKIQAKFDLGISLALSFWSALTLAVQNQWGGPDSSEKRDWFAGAISDLFTDRPDTDAEDVETVLLQVMNDEFDVNVEDDSSYELAIELMALRKQTLEGNFITVDTMHHRWLERMGKGASVRFQKVERGEDEDDTDWDSDDSEDEDGEDAQMVDAPVPVPRLEKPAREVDEEGFTKVVGKKKR
ncbi:MAG: hypothetical protein M1827_007634 [Pycnora praestabilis]|nr:MAG: hypothetical protein M1827_007634 [Pycnora praestabilis]